jgi:glycosyltransferase involved in cell wall biosynthesis
MAAELRIGLLADFPDRNQTRRNPWNLHHQVAMASKEVEAELVVFSSNEPRGQLAELSDTWRPWRPILPGSRFPPKSLFKTIEREDLDLLVFNFGPTSAAYVPRLARASPRLMGLLTTPIYGLSDIKKAGVWALATDLTGSQVHFLSPFLFNRRALSRLEGLDLMIVTLSDRNRRRLVELGFHEEAVRTLLPPLPPEHLLQNGGASDGGEVERGHLDDEAYTFLFMGAPTELRGARLVVRAFAAITETHPKAKLVFLSRPDSPMLRGSLRSVKNLAVRLGCEAGMSTFERYLASGEVLEHIRRSDVLLLPFRLVPSDLPMSILEAMAIGKPVVSTDVDGIPEFLGDGRGIVIPPSNLSALTGAMTRLIENPRYGEELGAQARAYVSDRYSESDGLGDIRQLLRASLDT